MVDKSQSCGSAHGEEENYILTASGNLYRIHSQPGLNESGLYDLIIQMELVDKNVSAINTRGPTLTYVASGGTIFTTAIEYGCNETAATNSALGRWNRQDVLGPTLNGVRVGGGEIPRVLCDADYCVVFQGGAETSSGGVHYWGHGLAPLGLPRADLPRTVRLKDLFPHAGDGAMLDVDASNGALAAIDGGGAVTFCNMNVATAQCRTRFVDISGGTYPATKLAIHSREVLYFSDREGHLYRCEFGGVFLVDTGTSWPAACVDIHAKNRGVFVGTTTTMLYVQRWHSLPR